MSLTANQATSLNGEKSRRRLKIGYVRKVLILSLRYRIQATPQAVGAVAEVALMVFVEGVGAEGSVAVELDVEEEDPTQTVQGRQILIKRSLRRSPPLMPQHGTHQHP